MQDTAYKARGPGNGTRRSTIVCKQLQRLTVDTRSAAT